MMPSPEEISAALKTFGEPEPSPIAPEPDIIVTPAPDGELPARVGFVLFAGLLLGMGAITALVIHVGLWVAGYAVTVIW